MNEDILTQAKEICNKQIQSEGKDFNFKSH